MAQPLVAEQFDLVRQKRPARHGHERFGNLFRDGPKPGRQAARENSNGNIHNRLIADDDFGAFEIKAEANLG